MACELVICLGEACRKSDVFILEVCLFIFQPAYLVFQECDVLGLYDGASVFNDEFFKLRENGDVHLLNGFFAAGNFFGRQFCSFDLLRGP